MTYSIHKILTIPTRNRLGQDSNMSSFTKGFNRDCKWLRMTWTSVPPNTRTLAVTTSLFMSARRMGTRLIVPIPALEVRTRLSRGCSSQFKPKGQISTRAPQSRFTIHETNRGSQSCVQLIENKMYCEIPSALHTLTRPTSRSATIPIEKLLKVDSNHRAMSRRMTKGHNPKIITP